MKIAVLVARILFGLMFFVFGLNKIVTFLPMPMPTGEAGALMLIWYTHKWLMFYGFIEAASGLMLLVGRFVPLGLTLLAGVGLNILLFHITFEPQGLAIPLVLLVLEIFLVYAYRASFAGIFAAKAQPTV
jgi:putative oxidoreductase